MISLFLTDDNQYLFKGVKDAIEEFDNNMVIIGTATSGEETLEKLGKLEYNVDIVLLDIIMPDMDGTECCKRIKKLYPQTKVIAFTGELNPEILLPIWLEKASAILYKSCPTEEIVRTIKLVLKGQRSFGSSIPEILGVCETDIGHKPKLTRRETEVLNELAKGITRQEAADILFISKYAIDFHCTNIFKKFKTDRIHEVIKESKMNHYIK